MQSEDRSSNKLKLYNCLDDTEAKKTLLGFFETLVEIAKENPELIQKNPPKKNEKIEVDTKEEND